MIRYNKRCDSIWSIELGLDAFTETIKLPEPQNIRLQDAPRILTHALRSLEGGPPEYHWHRAYVTWD